MKRNLLFIALFISIYNFSQVLITTNSSVYNEPDNSSVLQIADNDKGFLMPRIANENVISQPTESLTFIKVVQVNLISIRVLSGVKFMNKKTPHKSLM